MLQAGLGRALLTRGDAASPSITRRSVHPREAMAANALTDDFRHLQASIGNGRLEQDVTMSAGCVANTSLRARKGKSFHIQMYVCFCNWRKEKHVHDLPE